MALHLPLHQLAGSLQVGSLLLALPLQLRHLLLECGCLQCSTKSAVTAGKVSDPPDLGVLMRATSVSAADVLGL